MPEATHIGETLRLLITVADRENDVFNPDVVIITATPPTGEPLVHSTEDVSPTIFNTDTGIYWTYFDIDEDEDMAGRWTVTVEIRYSENGEDVVEIKKANRMVYS